MADLVMKQIVAVIDKRTTTVCLHAAGQIRPIRESFDTLLGEQMETPFHVHCRSMVVPWMPGFVSEIRKDANAELMRRPLKQRRIGPGGETGPLPRKAPDSGPLPPKGPAAPEPPVNAKTPIDRVPAAERKAFVEAHPERFEMTSNGGGISETYWVKDLQTGERYVLKAGQYHNESIAEAVGTRLGAKIGFPGEVLVASDMATGNGWVLLKHAEDIDEMRRQGYKVVGTGGSHGSIAKLANRLENPDEAVRKLLGDFVTDEADAKGGNLLLLSKDGGKTVRLVPIDRSLSQMGWRNAVEPGKSSVVTGDWSLPGRLKVQDLRQYMKTRGSPKGVLDMVQQMAESGAGRARIVRAYDEVLADLKKVDLDDLFEGLPPNLIAENRELLADRIRLLEEKRSTILTQMGVKKVDAPEVLPRPAALTGIDPWYEWKAGLSIEAAGAVDGYAGLSHRQINEYLRNPETLTKVQRMTPARKVAALDAVFDGEPYRLPEDATVFRGLPGSVVGDLRVGDRYVERGFTSTTLDPEIAEQFASRADDGWMMQILVRRGTKVVLADANDAEVLLRKVTEFRVTGRDADRRILQVEVTDG